MTPIDLQAQVRREITCDWPAFARLHPRMAGALDQDLLIESITAELCDDQTYQQVLARSAALNLTADTLAAAVRPLIRQALRSWFPGER